ncbi:MAG: NAD(P)-dependent glycerol-3-phosphate dehydrogenase [Actinobacteria bacterium]|nr:NAD(P)-dependent glycerol-3-phosphate dehydrogenase [Cyanobacteriota bacterium]MCL6088063.1 NAD(P)-dependent glycerol-3-phosphate dehydrogenase [Actinomycetota bacterium]
MKILIIGAGSWGTTLAFMLAEKGYSINIWSRENDVIADINNNRRNHKYTSGLCLHDKIKAFGDCDKNGILKSGTGFDIIVFAVPSEYLRQVSTGFKEFLQNLPDTINAVVNAAKGIELKTNLRMSQVLSETLPKELISIISTLSGPNISSEIIKKLPSVSTIASKNKKVLVYLQPVLSTDYFRVYTNDDLTGVEICGSVKNIIAIAAGISDGLGFGSNTKASLITRGLYELTKFGKKFGAKTSTFSGAAGIGDLITTCISTNSRNRFVGERIAKGEKIKDITENMYMVAEGVTTTKAVYEMSKELNIELPITECVYNVLYKNADPLKSVKILMTRKFKSEN